MICRYKIKFISDIEQKIRKLLVNIAVAPFVGVWIEMMNGCPNHSLGTVAPFVGVWIEILPRFWLGTLCNVAPFVGVWIEILVWKVWRKSKRSLPSWECGLKSR